MYLCFWGILWRFFCENCDCRPDGSVFYFRFGLVWFWFGIGIGIGAFVWLSVGFPFGFSSVFFSLSISMFFSL